MNAPPDDYRFGGLVLDALLRGLADTNADTDPPMANYHYGVSHAWLDGPVMYIVHTTKPSEPTWGLARDTRVSLIGTGAWSSASEAALLYQVLDFEEGWADAPHSADRDEIIHWRGDPLPNLPPARDRHPRPISMHAADRALPRRSAAPSAAAERPTVTPPLRRPADAAARLPPSARGARSEPSVTSPDDQSPATAAAQFAADVMEGVLGYIELRNRDPRDFICLVSHAWTAGPMVHLVYRAASSDRIWGLVRDTRRSSLDNGPWSDLDEAVTYTYFLDLEESYHCTSLNRLEPDVINWFGDRHDDLPATPSDIEERFRYTPPTGEVTTIVRPGIRRTDVAQEPRRYVDPDCLPRWYWRAPRWLRRLLVR